MKQLVKHTLLATESPKYLGTDNSMINIELMSKLYLVVAHNLNEARKARDGNKKKKNHNKPGKIKSRRQCVSQRSHIKSISAQIQRLLHSRTLKERTRSKLKTTMDTKQKFTAET